MDIEELINEVIRTAQSVTTAYEWGTGRHGAEKELAQARKALEDAISAKDKRIAELRIELDNALFDLARLRKW